MPICGLCQKKVAVLKTNSHVIPRWIMILCKENGRYVQVSEKDAKPVQTDRKADIVCEKCEDLFTRDDTFAALFFRDGKFRKEKSQINPELRQCEIHEGLTKSKLLSFFFSLWIRYFLSKSPEERTEDEVATFYKIRRSYRRGNLEKIGFFLLLFKHEDLGFITSLPEESYFDERPAIDVIILGYRGWIILDRWPPHEPFRRYINLSEVIIPIIPSGSKLTQTLATRIKEIGPLRKRNRKQ